MLRFAAERLGVMRQMVDPDARAMIVTRTRLEPQLAERLASSLEPSIELYVLIGDDIV